MREVVFQGRYFISQSQINRGAKDRKSRVMSFTPGQARFVAKWNKTLGSAQYEGGPKDLQQPRQVLGPMRIP